jgi:hypothetical protein
VTITEERLHSQLGIQACADENQDDRFQQDDCVIHAEAEGMEKPPTQASPEDGGRSVVSILMVVLLPAPLEPSKPNTSPALAAKVKEPTAVNVPKPRVRVSISTTGLISAESQAFS